MKAIRVLRYWVALVPLCLAVALVWLANLISGEKYSVFAGWPCSQDKQVNRKTISRVS